MKKPRKPKHKKYPKMPKQSASLATLKNYEARCRDVDKYNSQKAAEYNKKISEIAQAKSLRQRLVSKKHSGGKKVHLKVA